jgi:MFS superfamily sulfate permease-like transporter
MTVAILVLWPLLVPRRLKTIPAALVAVAVASVVAWYVPEEVKRVEVQSNLLAAVRPIQQADRSLWVDAGVWKSALTFALIASAETLLCAAAVDRMHRGPRTQYNRELSAQGVGNLICGALGVLPMTGVIVRSSANVDAGAKSRLSAVLHGAWLLAFVALFPDVLRLVPLTSLAAILVVTGFKLLAVRDVQALFRMSRSEGLILVVTALAIVATDLLVGVLTGVALTVAKLVWTFSHLRVRLVEEKAGRRTTLKLDGAATFLRLPHLADTLESVKPDTHLHVDFERLTYIDHACLELLMNWSKQHAAGGGRLFLDWDSLHARFHSPRSRPELGDSSANGHAAKPADVPARR